MKQVIHIFGASGSGTTTLGKAICNVCGYTFMDTDDYFWMPTEPPFQQKRPREERLRRMREDIARSENVVISGSLTDWGDVLIPQFTLAVRIEMDPVLRLERLKRREQERYGVRIEPDGDLYRQHLAFVEWAKAYDEGGTEIRSRRKHDEWQKQLSCELLCLDGADTLENNLGRVLAVLSEQICL